MARTKTHKFAVQTKGLTDEEAAQVMHLIMGSVDAFTKTVNMRGFLARRA
jgi:hypothetical protein